MEQEAQTTWRPNSQPQSLFLSTPSEIFEVLYGGAVFGGKTEALIHYPLVYPSNVQRANSKDSTDRLRLFEHPLFMGIIFRRTYKQLEESIIPRAREVYEKFGGKYNDTKHSFKFPSGAMVFLSYLETDRDAEQFDTSQFNLIMFEELTHFSQYQYLYMISRCRTRTKELPRIMRATATPGNQGHTWVRNRFIEPQILNAEQRHKAKAGGFRIYDPKSKSFRLFIRARATDNKEGIEANPTYIDSLRALPDAIAKARIDGDWDAFSGQVFAEFRSKNLTNEPQNACHVIKPIEIPGWWPKIISIDWGFTHATAVYWHAIAPDGRVYTYREMISKKEYIQTWAARLQLYCRQDQGIVCAVIDPSSRQNRGEPRSIFEQIEESLQQINIPLEVADNDRLGGKMLMHEFLRWEPLPERYKPQENFDHEAFMRLYRNYGAKIAEQYEQMFQADKPETNIPKWQIFDCCHELISCIPQLVYNESSNKDTNPEDVKKMDGDDPYDCCRYGLKKIQTFLLDANKLAVKHKSLASIVTDFDRTKDYTTLHNRMEALNVKQAPKVYTIKPRVFRSRGIFTG